MVLGTTFPTAMDAMSALLPFSTVEGRRLAVSSCTVASSRLSVTMADGPPSDEMEECRREAGLAGICVASSSSITWE